MPTGLPGDHGITYLLRCLPHMPRHTEDRAKQREDLAAAVDRQQRRHQLLNTGKEFVRITHAWEASERAAGNKAL